MIRPFAIAALLGLAGCGSQKTGFPDPAAAAMERLDADGSGELTADELRVDSPQQALALMDADRDGSVSQAELAAHLARFEIAPATPGAGGR